MNEDTIRKITEAAKSIIKGEHDYFVSECIDNSEHVLRIARIAGSVSTYFRQNAVSRKRAEYVRA